MYTTWVRARGGAIPYEGEATPDFARQSILAPTEHSMECERQPKNAEQATCRMRGHAIRVSIMISLRKDVVFRFADPYDVDLFRLFEECRHQMMRGLGTTLSARNWPFKVLRYVSFKAKGGIFPE